MESALKAATRAKADAQELSDNIKQIEAEKAALAANPPLSRAESALRTIQNILEITESLPNEIAKDLNKASTNLKKASDLWLASRAVE